MKKILVVLALLPVMALANTCGGIAGTAKNSSGIKVTRTAEEAKNLYIKNGEWWYCSGGSRATKPVTIPKSCPAVEGSKFRSWKDGPHTCTTYDKYATSATSPARDSTIPHGQSKMWRQWTGPNRGALIERCNDGVRTQVTAFCSPSTYCDVKYTFTNDGGKTVYVYDARGAARHVPLNTTVNAVAANGKIMPITCIAGDFRRN